MSRDPGYDQPEDVRLFDLRQPGARRRLLATKLADLETVEDLVRLLKDLDQLDHMNQRGLLGAWS